MENGFASSPARTDAFPAGLRVLVVDDDPTWLKILEKMLIKCSYEVTTCCLARNALDILRERKDGFDIVISDVNMPDMDGFKLLEHVGLEMDLPVIMMSVDGETSRVMKGVQHGACDYLLKPVRMKELRNIWQHVLRKKIHEVKDIESLEGSEDTHRMMSNGFDEFDINSYSIIGGDLSSARKRKDMEFQEHDDQDFNDPSAAKKARVVWSVDLHQKFVKAVNMIGFDKVGPKKILDLMNVPWLSRENVASHLQKYRLYLSRLQKQNEPKTTYGAIKQPDFTLKDPPTSFGFQSSTTIHQNDVASCSFDFSRSKNLIQDVCAKRHEGDKNDMSSFLPVTKTENTFIDDGVGPQKASISSRMGIPHSFGSLAQDMNYTTFGSTIPQQISWGREIPAIQLIEEPIEELDPYQYSYLPLPGSQPQIQVDQPQSAPFITPGTSITERDKAVPSEIKPLSLEYRGNHVRNVSTKACTSDSYSVHLPETDTVNSQAFGAMFSRLPSMISHSFDQNFISNLEPHQQSFILGSGLNLASSHEELLQVCSLHDYGCIETAGINSREILNCNSSETITELPSHFYEGMRFSSDYLTDNTLDYPIIDGSRPIHSMISQSDGVCCFGRYSY